MWAEFNNEKPALLGAAFIKAMGLDERVFISQFTAATDQLIGECAENDSLCDIIKRYLISSDDNTFDGTATSLHNALENYSKANKISYTEKSASALSRKIKQHETDLKNMGVEFKTNKSNTRSIQLTYNAEKLFESRSA